MFLQCPLPRIVPAYCKYQIVFKYKDWNRTKLELLWHLYEFKHRPHADKFCKAVLYVARHRSISAYTNVYKRSTTCTCIQKKIHFYPNYVLSLICCVTRNRWLQASWVLHQFNIIITTMPMRYEGIMLFLKSKLSQLK